MKKYENPDPEIWVVYAKIPRTLFHEFRDLGLVSKIDLIIENAIKNAVDIEKRGK